MILIIFLIIICIGLLTSIILALYASCVVASRADNMLEEQKAKEEVRRNG